MLKVSLGSEKKDWRIHAQQIVHYKGMIEQLLSPAEVMLENIHEEIERNLEQISSREKYINGQFGPLVHELLI
jgi:estrogen-related receptor beta like 1